MLAKAYMNYDLSRIQALEITGHSKHQLYHQANENRPGKRPTEVTLWKYQLSQEVIFRSNEELTREIIEILAHPDKPNWYRTVMTTLEV
jgi:hypothetical protein